MPGFGPPAAANEVGVLGPYRIVKELGKGGMGAVYAAIDTRLDRRLALKVMLPEFAADTAAKERFLREARAAAKISHDNVVTVYEADERQGVPYIAMQYLEGSPLDEYLKKKGLPTIPQVLRIAAETAAGLAAAHKIGLVHRDIKPANLWLEAPHGRVKVLDFGLAKPVDGEVELTKSGAVVGTPAYMSPEQAKGEKVDHRTDLFSLGSVLYRLCAGKLPFPGATTMAVLMALGTEEPPPVRELNPNVPESLAALIHQLLAKRADARPQSAAEVVKRLRAIAEELAAPRKSAAELSTSTPQVMQPQIVYAAMPVTAAPQQNPFAELGTSSAEVTSAESPKSAESTAATPTAKPKAAPKKASGRMVWVLVGGAMLAAVVAVGAIIATNKKGNETKSDPPDTTNTGGKGPNPPGPGKNPPIIDTSADRKAAEYVLSIGGTVRVNGEERNIKAATDLPKERFKLTEVHLYVNPQVTDAGLAIFKGCKDLTSLDLGHTPVTDAGLVYFQDCKELNLLGLHGTQVTDAGLANFRDCKSLTTLLLHRTWVTDVGLAHFKDCKKLEQLSLYETQVSDAGLVGLKGLGSLNSLSLGETKITDTGLAHLKEFKGLKALSLDGSIQMTDAGLEHLKELKSLINLAVRKTQVTAKGLAEFHAAVPGCRIEHDGGIIEAIDVDRKAAEWVIAQGGSVCVNGEEKEIRVAAELPKDRFTLYWVNLGETKVSDAGLEHLKGVVGLKELALYNTQVSDAGLIHLNELKNLKELWLNGTKVTDVGLKQIKQIKTLTRFGLDRTTVTDAGVEHLKELKNLTLLELRKTQVTAKGLADFHAAVPGCQIVHESGIIEAIDVDRKAAEWVIGQGGAVRVDTDNNDVIDVAKLPKGRFTLTWVELRDTKVTDQGLAQLKGLKNLTSLNLSITGVSDAGLAHLKELRSLKHLHLKKTKVTAKGLEDIRAALPGCTITHDLGVIEPKTATDTDRKAAEWVLSLGGTVRVNGVEKDIKDAVELPKDQVVLTKVTACAKASDAGLANLRNIKGLTYLNLNGSPVTNDGLAHLQELKNLTHFHLTNTQVSDAGLAHLKELKKLAYLALGGTKVADAGLEHLKELKNLAYLNLQNTPVTDAGVIHLQEIKSLTLLDLKGTKVTTKGLEALGGALPGCRIEHDGGAIEPKK